MNLMLNMIYSIGIHYVELNIHLPSLKDVEYVLNFPISLLYPQLTSKSSYFKATINYFYGINHSTFMQLIHNDPN